MTGSVVMCKRVGRRARKGWFSMSVYEATAALYTPEKLILKRIDGASRLARGLNNNPTLPT